MKSLVFIPKTSAIFIAKSNEGIRLPLSTSDIYCRVNPHFFENAFWLIFLLPLWLASKYWKACCIGLRNFEEFFIEKI